MSLVTRDVDRTFGDYKSLGGVRKDDSFAILHLEKSVWS